MGWSMELSSRSERLLPIVEEEVDRLVSTGAKVVALACNTTQYFRSSLDARLASNGAIFVDLVRPVREWLKTHEDRTIFVVAIGHVTSAAGWSAFPFLQEMPNVRLPDEKQSAVIERVAYDVKQNGIDHRTYQKFRSVVRDAEADVVLLLLTEFSMIFDKFRRTVMARTKIVDALDLLAERVVSRSIDGG